MPGHSDYIAKPVQGEKLRSLLRVWLDRPRCNAATRRRPDDDARPGDPPVQTVPKVNILMVDDTPSNLFVLEATLGDLGQNLVRAGSGVEALRRLLNDDFALILMDVQMPGMDGFEVDDMIRQRDRTRLTPIIFLTAYERTRPGDVSGLLGRRGRLSVHADRARGAAIEGQGVCRPALVERAGQAAGRAASRKRTA